MGGLSCGLCGFSIADAVWVVHCSGRFGGQYWWQFGGPLHVVAVFVRGRLWSMCRW